MKEKKSFICTRPRLARLLLDANQEPQEIVNPWEPQRTAWLFQITPELLQIVARFYAEIGKQLPKILQEATAEG